MSNKQIASYGPFQSLFAQTVKKGDTVYVAGQVSLDPEGKPVAPGDLVEQTRVAYEHVKKALAEVGASMDDIVDETLFITDAATLMGNIEAFAKTRAEAYGKPVPEVTQTCVQVAALVMPELVIEIKCVAQL